MSAFQFLLVAMGGTCAVMGVVFQVKIKTTERKIAERNLSAPTVEDDKAVESIP